MLHPGFEACDLALAETRHTVHKPGEFAGLVLRFGGDQKLHAILMCNRRSHKAVGGGDDDAYISSCTVTRDQFFSCIAHHRAHFDAHEIGVPLVQLAPLVARQWLELKVEEGMNVQRAGLVLFVKFQIFCLEQFAIEHALVNQKLRPLEIAVAAQQGIVQIK